MRSGELLQMKAADIDMTETPWTYKPRQHKTAKNGITKLIRFGPEAREILRVLIEEAGDGYLFSPVTAQKKVTAIADQKAATDRMRQMHRTWSREWVERERNKRAKIRPIRHWKRHEYYDVQVYSRAVRFASDRADIEEHKKRPSVPANVRLIPRWHPHMLRHAWATQLAIEDGIEAAQSALGHSNPGTTSRYVHIDAGSDARVEELMKRIG